MLTQPSPNALIAWLQENFLRLTAKSPKFFQVWQIISGALVLITTLPDALQLLNINLPDLFNDTIEKIVRYASMGILFMSFMPAQAKTVAVTKEGDALTRINADKLPFTAAQEQKKVEEDTPKFIFTPKT